MSSNVSAKVRAVYDALELRKNKQALKLLATLLDKKPANAQLRILKALALNRSGQKDEALALARSLKADKEVERDETLLNNLAIVFREAGAASEASECFASALRNEPQNEELALCLLGSYVRENNFLKLQQLSQNLHKQFGHERYYLWAIVATVLQVEHCMAPPKLLALTQKQLAKRVEEGKMTTYEELLLYLDVVKRQNKLSEAVALVQGPLGEIYSSKVERLKTVAQLLKLHGDFSQARAVYEQLLDTDEGQVKGAEEWSHIEGVLDCILEEKGFSSKQAGLKVSKEEWEGVLAEGQRVLAYLKSKAAASARTPFLAEVEFYTRIVALSHPLGPSSVPSAQGFVPNVLAPEDAHTGAEAVAALAVAAVLRYIQEVGDRDVCAYDLSLPLARLPRSLLPKVLEALCDTEAFPREESDGSAVDFTSNCHRFATVVKVRQMLGSYSPSPSVTPPPSSACATDVFTHPLLNEVLVLLNCFRLCSQKVSRTPGYPPDRSPSDDTALAGARILMHLYMTSGREALLVEAIVAARYGLSLSPTNFQYKLLLIRLYRMAGAFEALYEVLVTLDLKHILLDTLSYLIIPSSWEWGAVSKAKFFAEALLRLDRDNARDSPEFTFQAFKAGSFSKIHELLAFESRLRSSAQMAAAKMDLVVLSISDISAAAGDGAALREAQVLLATMGGVHPVIKEEEAWALKDNRDLGVEVAWQRVEEASMREVEGSAHSRRRRQLEILAGSVGPYLLAHALGVALPQSVPSYRDLFLQAERWAHELDWIVADSETESVTQRGGGGRRRRRGG